jgi:hypothetical protein
MEQRFPAAAKNESVIHGIYFSAIQIEGGSCMLDALAVETRMERIASK